ncbi:hypothetical protein ACIRON_05675 [Nocardioides sp. NPDC101246]|uniref:hypothetical protein n=1 Tax=Nocardioides sp. NPDC101246 TaxID=3364336 RepID=UPI0037FA75DE
MNHVPLLLGIVGVGQEEPPDVPYATLEQATVAELVSDPVPGLAGNVFGVVGGDVERDRDRDLCLERSAKS